MLFKMAVITMSYPILLSGKLQTVQINC